MSDIVVIFTCKTEEDFIKSGGTGWWKLNQTRARAAGQVLVVHNAYDVRKLGNPKIHGHPQFYATIRNIQQDEDGRCLIQFEKFAKANGGFRWPGFRNPVAYVNADEVLNTIEIEPLQEMPVVPFEEAQAERKRWDVQHGGEKASEISSQQDDDMKLPSDRNLIDAPVASRSFGAAIEWHRIELAKELGLQPSQVKISIEA